MGRTVASRPSQAYDRTIPSPFGVQTSSVSGEAMSPWPGKAPPSTDSSPDSNVEKAGVKWYGSGPKYVSVPHVT